MFAAGELLPARPNPDTQQLSHPPVANIGGTAYVRADTLAPAQPAQTSQAGGQHASGHGASTSDYNQFVAEQIHHGGPSDVSNDPKENLRVAAEKWNDLHAK
jgi:hypothetical protein